MTRSRRLFSTAAATVLHRPPKDKVSTLPMRLYEFDGLSDYSKIWQYQRCLVQSHLNTKKTFEHVEDALIVTEHKSVYTLGKGSTLGIQL